MATAVFFHAHPDDEALSTAGTMILAAEAGHRVVLVTATRGELGEAPGLGTAPGEAGLGALREAELRSSAEILGVERVELLGYHDSGMAGEPGNADLDAFWQADVDEATARLAAILTEESADLLTCYDPEGTYGHPDHIQVHRVGVRAADLAGVELVYEATVNRDHILEMSRLAAEMDLGDSFTDQDRVELEEGKLGVAAARITHHIDVSSVIDRKRQAMAAHRSQITDDSFFMTMPDEAFVMAFGTEWYIRHGAESGGPVGTDLFATLEAP
ncbi:MAG: PIG-L family deacetylase [Acidimicrobiales bacterium]